MTPRWIRIGCRSRFRTEDFFEQQDAPRRQVRMMTRERGRDRTCGHATTLIAPGIKRQFIVIGIQRLERLHGFEDRIGAFIDTGIVGDDRELPGNARDELWCSTGNRRIARIDAHHIRRHLYL
jgi:hypothetical protein